MTTEAQIQADILLALGSRDDVRLWRNETATGWVGRLLKRTHEGVVLAKARRLHSGLCNGSSDLVGIGPGGRMVCIEVKAPRGRLTDEQAAFLDTITRMGGIAGVARSVADAERLIEEAISE